MQVFFPLVIGQSTDRPCARQRQQLVVRHEQFIRINPRRFVRTRRHDGFPIRAVGRAVDSIRVPLQLSHFPACRHIPHPRRFVQTRRHDGFPIRAVDRAPDPIHVAR